MNLSKRFIILVLIFVLGLGAVGCGSPPTPPPQTPVPTVVTQYWIYTIQVGDTLSELAEKYQTTVSALMQLNDLASSLIIAGDTLKIPGNKP